jgi:DNA invertase Pin-like site-specific DNA recombinase
MSLTETAQPFADANPIAKMSSPPRIVSYVRISTGDQNSELQHRDLRDSAARMGREISHVYEDTTSGAKARRPGLDQLMTDARARTFDVVLVWKLDRFGRNLLHCLSCIEELQELGIRFIAITQGLDVDRRNPASKFLLHVLAAAAEFERSLILERTAAGKSALPAGLRAGSCR